MATLDDNREECFVFGNSHFWDREERLRDIRTGEILDVKSPEVEERIKKERERLLEEKAAVTRIWGDKRGTYIRMPGGFFTGPTGEIHDSMGNTVTSTAAMIQAVDNDKKLEELIHKTFGTDKVKITRLDGWAVTAIDEIPDE